MTTELVHAAPSLAAQPRSRRWTGRRVAWVLLFALVGGLLGAALGLRLGSRTEAQVSVVVRPLSGNAFSEREGNTLVDLETEAQLVVSDAVLRRVAQSGGPTADVLRRRLSVHVVDNAEVLVIRYRGKDQAQARATVERVAVATLAERGDRALATLNSRREVLTEQLTAALAALEAATPDSAAVPAQDPADLQQRLVILNARVIRLQNDILGLPTEAPVAGTVISSGSGAGGERTKVRLALILGCAAGAALVGAWVGAPGSRRRNRTRAAPEQDAA